MTSFIPFNLQIKTSADAKMIISDDFEVPDTEDAIDISRMVDEIVSRPTYRIE